MEDLGAEVSVYHGGEGFLSDWYDDYDNAIAPGLGYKHHVYIEWLQYASQLPASIASLTAIKDTLRFSNTPHVMQQWFQTAPACNTHGLTCGPDGQDDFTDLYNELSDSTGVDVIPVGEAFRNAYEAGVTTLHSDGTHASAQGEYLRNITIYGDLFDIDPRLMPTLGVTDASILQQAAFDAIQNQTH